MFIIILPLSNIAIIHIGVASPNQTKVWVDPRNILDTTLVPGKNFTISVNVFNVTNLYGYEIYLYYDTGILDGVSVELPPDHFLTPVDPTKILIMALEINDAWNATHGRVLASALLFWPEPVKNGSGTLITVTFEVTEIGSCFLDLNPAKIGDPDGISILHEDVDGFFSNKILGDVDGDGDVDYSDLSDFSEAYGSEPADPNCDFNKDDKVDASDLFILSKNYGKTVP